MLSRYGIYLLVMLASSMIVYIAIRIIQNFRLEQSEKMIKRDRFKHAELANGIQLFIDPVLFRQIQLSYGILAGGVATGTLLFAQIYNPLILMTVGGVFFVLGMLMPYLYYQRKVKRRFKDFESSILDLSMGLTSGLRAGQALPQALEVFSRRCSGVMREELMIVIREYRLGLELSEALQRMYERIPCEDPQILVVSIRLTAQSGGSLVDVLQRITDMIRSRTEFQQKLRALTAQGRFEALAMALAPLAAFILLFFINNDLMLPMVQTTIGWCAIGIMLTLEIIGYLVIRKIVNIKV